jgi:hypothetical protein
MGNVHTHGAGPATRNAAAELGPGHPEHIPQDPEQRHVVCDIDVVSMPLDHQL